MLLQAARLTTDFAAYVCACVITRWCMTDGTAVVIDGRRVSLPICGLLWGPSSSSGSQAISWCCS
eukprot:7927323-Pyramimonas_sp.AAC.1